MFSELQSLKKWSTISLNITQPERVDNLSYILADLNGKAKNAEDEKNSLITAMRLLFEDNYKGNATTIKHDDHPKDEINQSCEEVDFAKVESKQRSELQNSRILLSNRFSALTVERDNSSDEEDDHPDNKKKNDSATQRRKLFNKVEKSKKASITTVIVGDSMIKHLDPKRLKRSMKNGKQSVFVETYRGSNLEAMSHHIKPCLTKKARPNNISCGHK